MLAEKPKPLTYSDYEQLEEGAPCQLIEGELVLSPAPVPYHQRIVNHLLFAMTQFVTNHNSGEVFPSPIDVFLTDFNTFQPDIIFLSNENLHLIGEKKIEGAPDLVVEILSESTAYYDLKTKYKVYESCGVKEYWIVDPIANTIEVYQNKGNSFQRISEVVEKGIVESSVLAGFRVNLDVIF